MLTKDNINREFIMVRNNGTVTLSDPDPSMSPDAVLSYYMNLYPELVSASVSTPEYDDDTIVYKFRTVTGTKG